MLVVGFGPVGATMAGLLARRGVDVVAIDREVDVYPLPRAAHFDQEIMRIVQELGALDDIAPSTRPLPGMDFLTADRQVLLSMRSGDRTRSGFPSSVLFHQPGFDRAIRDHAVQLGARTLLGIELVSIDQHADHVTAHLGDGSSIEARWVVACDGARSTVRKAIGTTMDDLEFEEPWLVLDLVLADGTPPPADVCFQVCDPARPHTLVPMPAPRFRFEFMLLPGEDPQWIQQPEVMIDLLSAWVDPTTVTIERAAVYTFHGLVAHRWRDGRVLLAGDAAHQMPPFLGQGMCSGMRDAANLAWKLARVLRGESDAALLDTYQAERSPHVRAIVESAVGFGRLICTTDTAAAAARDEAMLAARAAAGESEPSGDDGGGLMPPLGPGPLVLDGGGSQAVQVTLDGVRCDDEIGDRFLVVVRSRLAHAAALDEWERAGAFVADASVDPRWAATLDAFTPPADAVVVRPDRYVLAAGSECPPVPPILATAG
ncbi:MAG: bifunctional 3-(3-hydroxy-phenyl)propionate/3-hydroxycinnamic acid hydroxylase [Actinobacteria bacterium]|nr:bifunctional 3-(3-hydroxy-phenyl)propionate/3-hydroxycinnamic acid hydroxylase [Actinomycetota bacterium]